MKTDFPTARVKAVSRGVMPYLRRHVMSLIPVETEECETMAVDKYGRLYYNPKFVASLTLDQACDGVIHEDFHVWLSHCDRKLGMPDNPTGYEQMVHNYAVDMVVNQMLEEADRTGLSDMWVHPSKNDPPLPLNLTAEEYYDLLFDEETAEKAAQQVKEICDAIDKALADSGSGSDGQPRPWEQGEPTDACPGHDKQSMKQLDRMLAQDIKKHLEQKGRGSVPSDMERFANEILEPAKDPLRELAAIVRYSLNRVRGFGTTTWCRPNRREHGVGVRMPHNQKCQPEVAVFVDTSGSMSDNTDLAKANGVIAHCTRGLDNERGLTVYSGDTQIAGCEKAYGKKRTRLFGGGGTDLAEGIKEIIEKHKRLDVIIVVTDGDTPWPSTPTKAQLIICLTSGEREVPKWATKVVV